MGRHGESVMDYIPEARGEVLRSGNRKRHQEWRLRL